MQLTDAALAADVAADAGKLLLAVREEVGFDDRTTSATRATCGPTS